MIEPVMLEFPGAAPLLAGLLKERRSSRSYTDRPLAKDHLADILWAAQGASSENRRTVPSAHAVYGVSVSVAIGRVDDVDCGLYRYVTSNHSLAMVTDKDVRPRLASACIADEAWVNDSAAIVMLSTDFEKVNAEFAEQWPHGQRGGRYAWLEAGHISQNVYLACAELDVGVTFVGGVDERLLRDDDCNFELFPPKHELLGLLTLGSAQA
ncbi:SagB/ThcOx family dehydrogenase [Rhodococcus sp. G-MC3]|uniref:SagB/ThcOx family dehydrogenase n=1 Tax=Rhodococcus sp. G-MC3 TaxID=3046209 RepID=UPI0024B902FF|nr:SagB/ThcOx family dehydrogenase [Rhodococcus sp. G-MC3]MDJ0396776.1 SagB/ThcOx family dehydrogenase [Rhodococcus sp. G-MC3]